MTAPIREAAPAKLTLFLHLTGRRDDGFHLLDGLIGFTDFGDSVEVTAAAPGAGLSLTVTGPFAPALAVEDAQDNLILRAARMLAEALGRPADLAFHLNKQIPVAAGLGGGSADAAAALRGLARLWRLPGDDPRLVDIAARLGSDVPACLIGGTLRIAGTGTALRALPPLPRLDCLLVNPRRPVATPSVYRRLRAIDPPPIAPRPADPPQDAMALLDAFLPQQGNVLTECAIAECPEIAPLLGALKALDGPGFAGLAGSGASAFWLGLPGSAATAGATIRARHPDCWLVETCLSGEARYVLRTREPRDGA